MRRVRAIVVIELLLELVLGLAPAVAWPAAGMHAVVRKPNVGVFAAPQAGAHLSASIHTGRACRYQPIPGGPACWHV